MAVELCLDSPSDFSHEISFSSDACQIPIEQQSLQLQSHSSNFDLDFSFTFNINRDQIPSADELFDNGKILPVGVSDATARMEKNPDRGSPPGLSTKEIRISSNEANRKKPINRKSSSISEHFLPVKIKKKIAPLKQMHQPIIASPFPPLQAFLQANFFEERVKDDTNPDDHQKKNSGTLLHFRNSTTDINSSSDSAYRRAVCPFSTPSGSMTVENHNFKQNSAAEKWKPPLKKSLVSNKIDISDYHILSLFTMELLCLACGCFNCKNKNHCL